VKEATSPFFVKACDEFIYLRGQGRGEERSARPAPNRTSRSHAPHAAAAAAAPGEAGSKKPRAVPEIAREVVSSLLSRATGALNPSLIKETIVRKQPDFDERDHGFSTFSRMLEAMEKEGLLKRQQQGRQWYVVPAGEGSPEPKAGHEHEHEHAQAMPHEPEEESIPDPEDDDLAL